MPVCQRCHANWSWVETMKCLFILNVSLTCPHCDGKQYYTAQFRKRSSFVPIVIITLTFGMNLLVGPTYAALVLLLGLSLLYFLLLPFFVQLSNEEEPLF